MTITGCRITHHSRGTYIADMYAVNIVDVAHKVRNKGMSWQGGINSVEAAQQTIQTHWDAYLNTELVDAEKNWLMN